MWSVMWTPSGARVHDECTCSRERVVCNLQFLFDFNLTLGYTYGVRVDKE